MYVDDLMKSVSSPEIALSLSTQLLELLAKGGFRLAGIPESERASSVVNLDLENLPNACALGFKWNIEADKFVWEVSAKVQRLLGEKSMTRREVLSIVSSLFDPLGFISPFIMKAKLLLQQLCWKG